MIEEIATPTGDRPNPAFVTASGADCNLVLDPLRIRREDLPRHEDRSYGTRPDFTRALAVQLAEDRNEEFAALLKRFLPGREVLGCHNRSPGLSRRCAAMARSSAALAAYRLTI